MLANGIGGGNSVSVSVTHQVGTVDLHGTAGVPGIPHNHSGYSQGQSVPFPVTSMLSPIKLRD